MRKVIKVSNIDCARCASTIETYFNNLDNISATVIVPSKKVIFEYNDDSWDFDKIISNLKSIGYHPILSSKEAQKAKIIDLVDMIIAVVFTLPLLWTMFAHFNVERIVPKVFMNGFFQLALASVVLLVPGRRFFVNTFNQIKNRNLGMDTLVIMGTVSAYIYSTYLAISSIGSNQSHIHYFFEATGTIISMVLIGNVIENRVKEKTSSTLESLMSLESKEAIVFKDGVEEIVPIEKVNIGDIIIVKANEYIPLDGVIIDGQTYIDEQTMTGELMPRKKGVDELVFAATTNILETIKIKVTVSPENTQLAKIIKTVEDTAKIKPRAQRIADKIASIFVPLVFLIAVVTFLIWFLVIKSGDDINSWLDKAISAAISVLVISCPCALGLATPTSISVASGIAFKNNILFKGGEYFEVSPKITTVCFDKTG
ncbi:HAD-IC family P-type ATPase, partial [Acholeplasma sp. OttesenSCG-928-E16]|nr:HAD-IC family P-type ATPase [Acholeplasma sp. OttesenSCG-928-E16]